ncbi:Rid family hydrolase [Sandarakinorhabdus sp.]|uniref:Rid family hydrolase n=1 Tax=Sandarakinorhabdus sp. TaxID=1916663 RepID=UPI00286EADC1|nr:Rid family hydrolase [Sandarakinorhabdus sp.]
MKLSALLACAALSCVVAAPAMAAPKANVQKITSTPPGRILVGAKVAAKAETFYLSGQLASPVDASQPSEYGDTKTQTISTLKKIKAALEANGYKMADIVRMDAYLTAAPNMAGKMDFAGFNAGFAEFFGTAENPTTVSRTTMQVAALAGPQFLVELTVIAAK